jgi:ribonuclease HII
MECASCADCIIVWDKNMTKKEEAAIKREERLRQETQRVAGMRSFEREAMCAALNCSTLPQGFLICGIDEAGRGPLAGPVAAGACILPADHDILYLNDSKKLSAGKRDKLYDILTKEALAWSVGIASPERIDEINILQATYEAMREAIVGLSEHFGIAPNGLVNDAVRIPEMNLPQAPVVKGDARCISVAAASILAKVTRDRMMEEYDRLYPEYGFAAHKGYGTKAHIEALKQYGPCPIHRRTFISHFVKIPDSGCVDV